ncbi:uncharacterized protein LOC132039334 [Lycium ferocissimum]|uniref:uncharacterized protein LOC132039334 n=1 Tax=Lycium ferocissimum TaxID=112874 RepID=UPI0028161A5C|nr:uncharacterized protein LOC132039334 [Lycium ferocissimum]
MVNSDDTELTQTNIKTNPVNDHSSPFYLHPSDSPGMLLVNSLFDGKGYTGWNRAFIIALSAKNKLGMIDGTVEMPDASDPDHKIWTRSREIWKELATRFGRWCNGAQLYQLQKELSDAVRTSDIAGYFTKVKKIWDELNALITFDHCSCKCICGGKVKTIKSHQDGRLIEFLMGLNNSYSSVKSTVTMMDPLPTVGSAYSLLIQEEKQREVYMEAHPSEAAFMVSNQKYNNNVQRFANNNQQKYAGSEAKYKGNFITKMQECFAHTAK